MVPVADPALSRHLGRLNDQPEAIAVSGSRPAIINGGSGETIAIGLPPPQRRPIAVQMLVGFAAAAVAVLVRYLIPLPIELLPTLTLVIAVCVSTVFIGAVAGVTTMLSGGLLAWYLFFEPRLEDLAGPTTISFVGYLAVTSVIIATSYLYRRSEQRYRIAEVQRARDDAEKAQLFAREMAHRLKNALAIVQAMAGQTFTQDSPQVAKFAGRLKALSRAHNLLSEHVREPTASLDEVVANALAPFDDWADRFRIAGPAIEIPDQQVVSLALALHELGTNAIKYGALSGADGTVSVTWTGQGRDFELVWKEHDGPPVARPETEGFGARLLNRAAMRAELFYEPDGVRCVIRSA